MSIGNKAHNLQILKDNGFSVPDFFVLPPSFADKPDLIIETLHKHAQPHKKYAVRSSGIKEDMPEHSFAGQYYTGLNVQGYEDIFNEVQECYDSVNSSTVQAYIKRNALSNQNLKLAVIIQEMVQPDYSGIAFTVNPMSGADKEIVIEIAPGLGDAVVGGRISPEEYIYNWYSGEVIKTGSVISPAMAKKVCETMLAIQKLFGYPCDIEFAIKNSTIYILQARAITKILYSGIRDEWSTADFRDGGVSSSVCKPFMWSLYEYVWETEYRDFLRNAMFLDRSRLGKLSDMFYGRPYWNLSTTKLAMSQVPGYKERDFDNDLGIAPTYEGDGVTTSINPKTLAIALLVYVKNRFLVRARLKSNIDSKEHLLNIYKERLHSVDGTADSWKELIFTDYLLSEGTYFNQIFINTVAQSIYKESILKYTNKESYLKLLMGLKDISHLRPYQVIWQLSRNKTVSSDGIVHFIEEYGYHSDKELDVSYPHFAENPATVRRMIEETAQISAKYDPNRDLERQYAEYETALSSLPKKLHKSVREMRELLWWREEFRDISTRYYYLIRLYTLELAKSLQSSNVIAEIDDIWYLKITDIRMYLEHHISADELRAIISKNRDYYESFRNFTPENEIGYAFNKERPKDSGPHALSGLGCSSGIVTGTARIVEDIAHISEIRPGDILVTKYTDTGWTSKFSILSGVVTEYGGILCHAAIVSREYGLPCVVCATDIMKKVKNGETITINGATGEITKVTT
jgi:phosphohistidine swiveling domain-containing protein